MISAFDRCADYDARTACCVHPYEPRQPVKPNDDADGNVRRPAPSVDSGYCRSPSARNFLPAFLDECLPIAVGQRAMHLRRELENSMSHRRSRLTMRQCLIACWSLASSVARTIFCSARIENPACAHGLAITANSSAASGSSP
jgi:hypothetical protein